MLIEAVKMLRQADKDVVPSEGDEDFACCNYGVIDSKLIEQWDELIRKIRKL
jgi:hypothetical protein